MQPPKMAARTVIGTAANTRRTLSSGKIVENVQRVNHIITGK